MKLIYKDEVLEMIGCSRPTLDQEVKRGALPPGRLVDGRVAWLESEILTYLESLPRQRFTGRIGRPRKDVAAA